MGNGPSKRSRSRSRGRDFTIENKPLPPLARHTSSYQSAPPPYAPPATSPLTDSLPEGTPSPLGSRHTKSFTIPPPPAPRTAARSTNLRTPLRAESLENALETLRQYDTVILMDDSSSMAGSLWKEAKRALATLADVASQYDANGIDIHFLNYYESLTGVTNGRSVNDHFAGLRPEGPTPIGHRLDIILGDYFRGLDAAKRREDAGDYFARRHVKPVNVIVITDGTPTDDPESVIVSYARRLDADRWPLAQVGIQFVQIGTSKQATRFLKDLDDSLTDMHHIRDIVDTTPYIGELNAEMLIKVLLGGINRRVDKKGGAAVMF